MMVQTLIPCSPASKTEEILSRYRPIAPKPELPASSSSSSSSPSDQVWANLQARPSRTRKRGRSSPYSKMRPPNPFLGLSCPPKPHQVITLPLLPKSPLLQMGDSETGNHVDLEEKDLILELKSPCSGPSPAHVISPKAVRPVGSVIKVGAISGAQGTSNVEVGMKGMGEVEAEAEAIELPVVISDSNNKVRMANSAYKEMVGQPECSWLDELMRVTVTGRRIGGEVMLQLPLSTTELPAGGFSCPVRIEWRNANNKGSVMDAFCHVVRLNCENKDYLFCWRFHTNQATTF